MRWLPLRNVLDKISKLPVWLTLCIELLLVAVIGYIDYITGDYSVLIFYAIPICIAAWSVGDTGVILVSISSGAARFISDYSSYSNSKVRSWNTFEDILYLLIFGLLIAAVKRELDEEGGDSKKHD
jgi:hypothetical protein